MYAGVVALLRTPAARLGVPRLSAGTTSPANLARQALSFARQRRPLHLSSSPLSSSPAPSKTASTDPNITTEATSVVKPKLLHTNLARNSEIRYAYRDKTPEIEAAVEAMLGTAYIPPARQYPTAESTALSLQRARRVARIRVGEEMLARKDGKVRRRDAADSLGLLKNMTQARGRKPSMHAMRIVLPREWDLDVPSGKNVKFVEARTGLAARLRITSDHENATAIVMRGQEPILAKAADEIIAVCKDVEIFKLGEVTSFDYAAQRLWPPIEDAEPEDGGDVVPPGQLENIWLHKEQQYWIDSAYEKTPRPEVWTKPSFDMFIKSLVYGRLKPGLPRPVYPHGTHTDKIRVRMIMEAFGDPSARRFITTPILKMALQFMAAHGGHRASAERLLSQAERWGVPLDTDAFNILLDCYVRKHDVRFFHKVLSKMRERCFYPDARTWLHFLRLVQRDDVRLQVEAAMFDLGLFDDPNTRRSVGVVTAGTLAHQALRAGETLPAFLDKQAARFGSSWLADEDGAAANAVLTEFFLFYPSMVVNQRYHDYRVLINRLISERSGSRGAVGVLPASTLNLILEHCAQPHVRDWDTALWALDLATPAMNPRDDSAVGERAAVATAYRHLVDLCVRTRSPAALAAVVFYAVKERALSVRAARTAVTAALLGKAGVGAGGGVDHPDAWGRAHAPQLLSRDMAATLRKNPVESKAHAVRAIEVAIRDATAGYVPADRLVEVLRAARALDQQQDAAAAASNDGDAVAERPALTIELVGVEDGEPAPRTQVRLDSAFDVRRMVLYNQHATPPWRKRAGGEKAIGASSSKIGSSSSASLSTEKEAGQEAELVSEATAAQDSEKSSGNHPLVQYLNSLH